MSGRDLPFDPDARFEQCAMDAFGHLLKIQNEAKLGLSDEAASAIALLADVFEDIIALCNEAGQRIGSAIQRRDAVRERLARQIAKGQ